MSPSNVANISTEPLLEVVATAAPHALRNEMAASLAWNHIPCICSYEYSADILRSYLALYSKA